MTSSSFDLAVVGGGPAGLATAFLAEERGLNTVLFEQRTPPIDKACGEGLMPEGRAFLRNHDVPVDPDRSYSFEGIRYFDGHLSCEARFQGERGLGYRRTALHKALVKRARRSGVTLHWGCKVSDITDRAVLHENGRTRTRWIVGADGLHSRVRQWAGIEKRESSVERFGLRKHFPVEPWSSCVEVYWGDHGEAYVTPVGPEEVCVAIMREDSPRSFDGMMEEFPRLQTRLKNVDSSSSHRGSGPLYQVTESVVKDPVALVGDAAGFRDSITGKGLSLAFRQSEYLVDALVAGNLDRYRSRYWELMRLPNTFVEILLWLRKHPRIRRTIMRFLKVFPGAFEALLEFNDGVKRTPKEGSLEKKDGQKEQPIPTQSGV